MVAVLCLLIGLTSCSNKQRSEFYLQRGMEAADKEHWESAVFNFSNAIEHADENEQSQGIRLTAHLFRGRCYTQIDKLEEAVADYNVVLAKFPDNDEVIRYKAWALYRLQKYQEAADTWSLLRILKPEESFVVHSLAWAAYCKADFEKCIELARKCIEMDEWKDDDSAYGAILIHFAHKHLGEEENARLILEEAIEKMAPPKWPHSAYKYLLGKISASDMLGKVSGLNTFTEGRTYVGVKMAMEGDPLGKMHLQWVVDHGNKDFYERELARCELKWLEDPSLLNHVKKAAPRGKRSPEVIEADTSLAPNSP